MINELITAFVRVFGWTVDGNRIISTPNSISNREKFEEELKNLPEDDPFIYTEKDLLTSFEFWCRDNQIQVSSVEMSRGDFWNSPDESAESSIDQALAEHDAAIYAQAKAAEEQAAARAAEDEARARSGGPEE